MWGHQFALLPLNFMKLYYGYHFHHKRHPSSCLLSVCSIIFVSCYCRHSHNQSWNPIACRVHEPLLESACTGVVGHLEVPDSEEEMQSFEEHPGKGGQVEVMQYPCDDGTQHLEGREELGMWCRCSLYLIISSALIGFLAGWNFNSSTCDTLPGATHFLEAFTGHWSLLVPCVRQARNTKESMSPEQPSNSWQMSIGIEMLHCSCPLGGCDG